jgi:Sec-independent protein translocase protein TatA
LFGIGGIEFAAIVVLALLLLGPDKIPQVARTIGRFMREFKKYQAMMESTFRAEMLLSEQEEAAKKAEERKAKAGDEQPPAKIPGEVGYETVGVPDEAGSTADDAGSGRVADEVEDIAFLSEDDDPDVLFDPNEKGWTPGTPGSPGMEDTKEDGETT